MRISGAEFESEITADTCQCFSHLYFRCVLTSFPLSCMEGERSNTRNVALFFVVVLLFKGRQNIRILCLSSPFKSESTACAVLQAGK